MVDCPSKDTNPARPLFSITASKNVSALLAVHFFVKRLHSNVSLESSKR